MVLSTGGSSLVNGGDSTVTANNNTVNIVNSVVPTITSIGVLATAGEGSAAHGHATATANYNILNVENSTAVSATGSLVRSSSSPVNASNGNATATSSYNTVNLDNSTVDQTIIGGSANSIAGHNSTTTANFNTITHDESITNGRIIGGLATSEAGSKLTATASFNSVHVVGGLVQEGIIGGSATAYPNPNGISLATSNNNTINIGFSDDANSDIFSSTRVGDYAIGGFISGSDGSVAENNSITLSGHVTFEGPDFFLTGGLLLPDPFQNIELTINPNTFDGNTVHFNNYRGNKINSIGNFETYHFTLGKNVANGSTIVQAANLYLANALGSSATKSASIGTISVMQGSKLKANDKIVLIDYDQAYGTIANHNGIVQGRQGAFVNLSWLVEQNSAAGETNITATALPISNTTQQTQPTQPNQPAQPNNNSDAIIGSVMSGFAQSTGVVDIATDLAASGAQDAVNRNFKSEVGSSIPAGSTQKQGSAISTFATVAGGTMHYNTDTSININSLNLVSGVALGHRSKFGNLLLSAFFEGSTASYYTYNDVKNAQDLYGDGKAQSYGFGLLGRYDFYTNYGTPYVEASFHHGQVRSEYNNNDVFDPITLESIDYEHYVNYTALHLGLGYLWQINENSSLDVYGKYFYTHQAANELVVLQESFAMDSINSHRLRLGARYNYNMNTANGNNFKFYGGLAFEHEFDGELKASIRNINIDSQSLQGSTYIGELGISFSPAAVSGLSLDLGVQGYLGKREGIMGKFGVRYEF